MARSLYEISQQITEQKPSPVTSGKIRVKTDEVIAAFPDGIHINGAELRSDGNGETYGVFTCVELPGKFFYGGAILNNILFEWSKEYAPEVLYETLQSNPIGYKLEKVLTKKGKTLTVVTPLK